MPVIGVSCAARDLSPFMFSAVVVSRLASSGLDGIEPAAAGAERLPEHETGPMVLR